ncbi:MAG: NYN domain-containing protein [Aliidongia sp.]
MVPDDTNRVISRERIGLFIDGWHLSEAARALKLQIDYGKLLRYFEAQGEVVQAFYYNASLPGPEGAHGKALYRWLGCHGYTNVIKEAKSFIDDKGIRRVKNYLEADMVLDMVEMAPCLDHVVLFSGLGDLSRVVETVQRKGKRVTVVSTVRTRAPMAAWSLRRLADRFEDLFDLAPLIARMPPHAVAGGAL